MTDLDRDLLKAIVDTALDARQSDASVVGVDGHTDGATRYANNAINQNQVRGDRTLWVEAAFGNRVGYCVTNALDTDSVVACVRRAETIARVTPPDPEYMPPVAPAQVVSVDAHAPATAATTPDQRRQIIGRAVALAERERMTGAGLLTTADRATAVGNSAGAFQYQRSSSMNFTFSATAGESVGWAQAVGHDSATIEVEAVARRAIQKAAAGRSPRRIEPGSYQVVFEPAATADLISFLFWVQLDAKACDEGRTFLSGKKGQRLAAPSVRIYSDPADPACPACPFTGEGLPQPRVDWFRDGVLENLIYSRFWAKKQGVPVTPWPSNYIMAGGDASLDQLIAGVKRGLLVTRLWYVNAVEVMRDLYSGMTRDGTFLIENGAIVGPVMNMRFNHSALQLLASVEQLGQPELVYDQTLRFPALRASAFNFTGATDF